jgi:hypothetical protein
MIPPISSYYFGPSLLGLITSMSVAKESIRIGVPQPNDNAQISALDGLLSVHSSESLTWLGSNPFFERRYTLG